MIEFKNCDFISKTVIDYNHFVQIIFGQVYVSITNCNFKDVDAYIGIPENDSRVVFKSNNFIGRHVTMSIISLGAVRNKSFAAQGMRFDAKRHHAAKYMESRINKEFVKEYYESDALKDREESGEIGNADIFRFLRMQEQKLEIRPEDIQYMPLTSEVIMRGNRFPSLILDGECYRLEGGNRADNLATGSHLAYFSPHQNLTQNPDYAVKHREAFLKLRAGALERGDAFQEQVYKREVLKCERQILQSQDLRNSWQDRLVLWWGEIASMHGISWARPLVWLLLSNLFFALSVICLSLKPMTEFWRIYFNLLHPFGYFTSSVFQGDPLLLLVVLFQKIVLLLFIYETIRAARRFAR